MAYVAVKGGEQAILNSHKLLAQERRGNMDVPELSIDQISTQLGRSVDRVMTEGSIYDRGLAALALKQAQGDVVEAVFLLRAYRTTLPRIAASEPIDTTVMAVRRRISATFKDIPGGQVLGSTYDYTHRLLDFTLMAESDVGIPEAAVASEPLDAVVPSVIRLLEAQGLVAPAPDSTAGAAIFDLSRQSMRFPAGRDQRLQSLARADEGFILGLAYSSARGFGGTHPFVGELRVGEVVVEIIAPELGFAIEIAEITVTECQMINQFRGTADIPPQFTRGYGLTLGHCERKAMAMALVDRSLQARELGESVQHPAQDEEFVLSHADNVEADGYVTHFKLPHYVDFQAALSLVRQLREEWVPK
jgi:alpha-D-ribose 1-methylphosphonate 5-triphosphate synthase subunit PhnI